MRRIVPAPPGRPQDEVRCPTGQRGRFRLTVMVEFASPCGDGAWVVRRDDEARLPRPSGGHPWCLHHRPHRPGHASPRRDPSFATVRICSRAPRGPMRTVVKLRSRRGCAIAQNEPTGRDKNQQKATRRNIIANTPARNEPNLQDEPVAQNEPTEVPGSVQRSHATPHAPVQNKPTAARASRSRNTMASWDLQAIGASAASPARSRANPRLRKPFGPRRLTGG
jgi:hypothetical protein